MASETRDRIVDQAARLFHENGYEATGIATILRAAEVNSGSLYHFFSGKEDLLVAVLERHLERLGPRIVAPVEESLTDPVERVFGLLDHYRRGLQVTGCERGCPVGKLAMERAPGRSPVQALIDGYFGAWAGAVERWLDQAGDRLPRDLDRAALSRLVLGVMEGGVMQAQAAGLIDPFDQAVDQLRSYFVVLERRAASGRAAGAAVEAAPASGAREPTGPGGSPPLGDRSAWRSW